MKEGEKMKKSAKEKTAEDKRTVFIPKEYKGDDALFVAVNGERLLVKKGEQVLLPARFAEVIENSFEAKKSAESFISAAGGSQ